MKTRDSALAVLTCLSLAGCSAAGFRTGTHDENGSREPAHAAEKTNDISRTESEIAAEAKRNTARAVANTEATAEYHFSLAQAYVAEGNPDRAIEEYKLTLMFDPNSSLVYSRLATEYVKKGALSAAMDTCKEALQRDPKFIDTRLMLAGLYSMTHETQAALNEYDIILKQDPKHEEAAVYKAQVLAEAGKTSESTKILRNFVAKNKESILAWYYLGRIEQQADHAVEAAAAYKKALALKPGFGQAALALGYLYEEKGKNAEAIKTYEELFEESQDLSAANRLATIYLKNEKYEAAVPYLQAIESADSDDLNVRVKLGLVYMQLKKFDLAIPMFKKILTVNPDSDRIHYYLGSLYEETKQVDQAIVELKMIKPDSKLFTDAVLHAAYLMKQDGKIAESKAFIRDAIERQPRVANFYVFEASLEEETKNSGAAIAVLEKAVEKFPEDEKVRYYLGSLYDRRGDVDKGLEQMEAILRFNPENVDALNYIGYTWTTKGVRLSDAEKLLKRALALKPDNAYIQDSWGWYLFVRGRLNESIVELEKAAKLKPNEPTILEHLGDAYLRSNLREKALVKYRDAARLADDETAKKKLENKVESLKAEIAQNAPAPRQSAAAGRLPASNDGQE